MSAGSDRPSPLGARFDGAGVHFSIRSRLAGDVRLCLFSSADDRQESKQIPLRRRSEGLWDLYLPGIGPGQLYGYRIYGPYQPARGLRFNPHKLLLDPYALAVERIGIRNDLEFDSILDYERGEKDSSERGSVREGANDFKQNSRDSAPHAPLGVVVADDFDWIGDRPVRIPWRDTIIYEAHVKGLTARHPELPPHLRGTYSGLATEPVIAHLRRLGVTTIELLPVQQHFDEPALRKRNLTNYWGYNTLAFLAPDRRFAVPGSGPQDTIRQFKEMVCALHQAGLEVILDVVYNHTAEGDEFGPTLSLRGIDNPNYYHLEKEKPVHYFNPTGCGNALNMNREDARQLVLDSLRYWVREMHVDGFRFDLAVTLGRRKPDFDPRAPFFRALQRDPLLSSIKLIAEPWDTGSNGVQTGGFPRLFSEWNDRYRDTMRRLWRGDRGQLAETATRIAGSADLFNPRKRPIRASINYITSHDGFTLWDLVSYRKKNNRANQEENRDGTDENISFPSGAEGPTSDPVVLRRRFRQMRNFITTLMISQGVPMIGSGDELGRTQLGNNNAYCQDNAISYVDWNLNEQQNSYLDFVCRIIALRKNNPLFRRKTFFSPTVGVPPGEREIIWYHPGGREMSGRKWLIEEAHSLGFLLNPIVSPPGEEQDRSPASRPVPLDPLDPLNSLDPLDPLYIMLNAAQDPVSFRLPEIGSIACWRAIVETFEGKIGGENLPLKGGEIFYLREKSIAIFQGGR